VTETDMRLKTKTGQGGHGPLLRMWKVWRDQPEANRPAFVEACLGRKCHYMVIDFLALCEGAGPSVFPLVPQPAAACASCVSCLPSPNPCPPAPARATSCSEPLGCALRRLEPEAWNHRGECSRMQRFPPAASADGGARGVWRLHHERGAPAPAPRMLPRAPLRSTIGVQASPRVDLGYLSCLSGYD
jgi:hypothetical protein